MTRWSFGEDQQRDSTTDLIEKHPCALAAEETERMRRHRKNLSFGEPNSDGLFQF
jgi:hypothetical protein